MIAAYKKMRQSLLRQKRFKRYLIYAIGEIILVVIGILIALQINNWNEHRKLEANTVIYVESLIGDIKRDTSMLANQIAAARLKYYYCKTIDSIINSGSVPENNSAFVMQLQSAGRLVLPAITDNTYRDLVSTGNLKLINDKKIINAIGDYYSNPLFWWYDDYKNQLVNEYLPIVVDAIPIEISEEILRNEIVQNYSDVTDGILANQTYDLDVENIDDILVTLRRNEDFAFYLKKITRSHLVHEKILGLSYNSASSLLNILEDWKGQTIQND